MKRAISAFLAAVVLALNFAACDSSPKATPVDEFTYAVANGNSINIISYDGDRTVVVMPDEIEGYPVKYVQLRAFTDSKVKTLYVNGTMGEIYSTAFFGCSTLENVIIREGITLIWGDAFKNCDNIKKVTIPQSVKDIGSDAFSPAVEATFLGDAPSGISNGAFGYGSTIKYKKGASGWDEIVELCDSYYNFVEY